MAQAFNLTAKINLQGPYNLRPIVSKIKKDIGAIKPELKFKLDASAAKSVKNVTAEIKKLDSAAKSAKKSVGSLNSSLQTLSASFNIAANSSKNAANATAAVTKATSNAAKSANQARTAMEQFGKQSGLAIKRFAAFSSVTTVIYGLTNAIIDGYKEFLVFNKEIVRLSQVTNKSVADLGGITQEISRLSSTIGVASSDLITVASTLAQAGLSAEDTRIALEALAKSSLAPSFEDISKTTEGAIAAIRQFGLQASELESALGSINAVAAAFAVESGDIISAIQRTGGVFASSSRGVSEGTDALNEFIAIFTSVRQTTRESAETIATGLRTIFTRIQRSSTIELLKQYGVELRDLEGKFVGPYEAVRRLSEGLSRIDPRSAEFARISEELGGFRQIGKVIPLIQQFAVAQDALNVAQKGAGSLSKDVITAQQSLAVQFTKTRENFLALVREIGDSTSFKVFISSTLFLTNTLIDLGRTLKPLLPLLLTFGAIKIGSSLSQFASGFGMAFGGRGGGGPPSTGGGGGTTRGGGGGGGGGNQPLTSALTLNSTATNALAQTITTLNTSVQTLNQNIINLLNKPTPGFASGGLVPGAGNSDTYAAKLTPGEFVIRKKAVETIGAENLARMNSGGFVRRYEDAGAVTALSDEEILKKIFGDAFDQETKQISGKIIGETGIKASASATQIRKSRSLSTLSNKTGIPLDKLQEAQISLKKSSSEKSEQTEANRQASLEEKQKAITSRNVMKFGLVGLRYGSEAKGLSSLGSFPVEVPPTFQSGNLENIRLAKFGDKQEQFVEIITNTVSSRFGADYASKLQNILYQGFEQSVTDVAKSLAKESGLGANIVPNPEVIQKSIENAGFYNVVGAGIEGALNLLGAPLTPKDENTKSIDFPTGLKGAASIFGKDFTNIPTDITRTIGPGGKGASDYIQQIQRYFKTPQGQKRLMLTQAQAFAAGGSVEDTVPALLTPGEFVFNKKAAQRIGYSNLNRLNKADKIQGFNKGGIVGSTQRFAAGGSVDPVLAVSAIVGVLTQEIEKITATFSNLDGQMKDFGIITGDIIKSVSSQVASTTIALSAMGIQGKTLIAAQAGSAIGAGLGAGISSSSTRALDKLLSQSNIQLGEFNKHLKDLNEATTEELRSSGAKRLEQSFIELDKTVRSNSDAIDTAENFRKLGNATSNITSGILSTVTSMSALRLATIKQTSAINNMGFKRTAEYIGTFGAIIGFIGKFAGVIGVAITIFQVAIEAISYFTSKTKTSADQFDALNDKLKETIANSSDYNLANENLINNILPKFRQLQEVARKSPGDYRTNLEREIATQGGSTLDLRLRTQFKSGAQNIGYIMKASESIDDFLNRMRKEAPVAAKELGGLLQTITNTRDLPDVRSALREQGLDPEQINTEIKKLTELGKLGDVAERYRASQTVSILSTIEAADATKKITISFLNLNNVLSKTLQIYEKSFNDLTTAFNELNITAGPTGQDTSVLLASTINTFKDLSVVTSKQLQKSLDDVFSRINLPDNLQKEFEGRIKASKVLQQQGPMLLQALQQPGGLNDISGVVKEFLSPQLKSVLPSGINSETLIASIVNEVAASLGKIAEKDGDVVKAFDDLAKDSKALGELLSSSNEANKFAISSTEIFQKAQKALYDEQRKVLELEIQIKNATLERLSIEKQDRIKLQEAFDINVPLQDRLKVFDDSILQLTSGLDEGISLINQSRATAAQRLQLIPRTGMAGAVTNQAISSISRPLATGPTTNLDTIIQTRRLAREQLRDLERGGINATEIEKQKALNKVVENTTEALKRLINNGDQVNLVFEQIAKQRDLFKSRRELLFDLVKKFRDPAQAVELQRQFREFQAIGQAMQGRGTVSQDVLLRALTNENYFTKFFDTQQLEDFIATGSKQLVNQQMQLSPEIRGVLLNINQYLSTQGNTTQLVGILEKLFGIRTKAATALEDEQKTELEKRQSGIISAYSQFENDFRSAAQKVSDEIKSFGEQLTANRNARQMTPETAQIISDAEIENLKTTFGKLTYDQAFTSKSMALFSKNQIDNMMSQIAGKGRAEALSNLQQMIISSPENPVSKAGRMRFGRSSDVEQTNEAISRSNAVKAAYDFIRLMIQQESLTQPKPNRSTSAPAPIDSGSIDRFSGAASKLTAALSDPNNNITGLTTAVDSLGTVTTDLKNAVNQLSSLFKDGKIQLLSETKGNVNVSFDSPVVVESNNNLNDKVLGELQNMVQENVSIVLNAWGRKNGIQV